MERDNTLKVPRHPASLLRSQAAAIPAASIPKARDQPRAAHIRRRTATGYGTPAVLVLLANCCALRIPSESQVYKAVKFEAVLRKERPARTRALLPRKRRYRDT